MHEDGMPPLAVIKMLDDPRPRRARDFSTSNDEDVIEKNLAAQVGIEHWVIDCHFHLRQNIGGVV
jgi:hypothetical protein